jgi:hypothetical protein
LANKNLANNNFWQMLGNWKICLKLMNFKIKLIEKSPWIWASRTVSAFIGICEVAALVIIQTSAPVHSANAASLHTGRMLLAATAATTATTATTILLQLHFGRQQPR